MNTKHENQAKGLVIKNGRTIYTEIKINASSDKVWKFFTEFQNYSQWNPFIKSLNGNTNEGQTINVFLQPPGKKGMMFKPTVLVYNQGKEFRWLGKLGIGGLFDGEHVFQLQANADGSTTFIQFECFRGILIPFLKNMLNQNTKQGFILMNDALKKRCEE